MSTKHYGIYSNTQFKNLCQKGTHEFPYIYYKDINDNIVQVTEVISTSECISNFNDALFIGELKSFHCCTAKPLELCFQSHTSYPP